MALAEHAASVPAPSPAVRAPERWQSNGGNVARRLESWAEILAATHVTFDVRATRGTPDRFVGAVSRWTVGDLVLVDCAAPPFLGHRSRQVIASARDCAQPDSIVGLQIVCKGVERVREGARERALTAGDVFLWDGPEPTEVEILEPFRKRTLMFPRDRVLAVCPRLAELPAFPLLQDSGTTRLLVRYVNALAAELPRLDPAAGIAASDAALELLRGAIEPGVPAGRPAMRAAMRAEIRHYVRGHLQDPALGPPSIARAYGMSVRALHALFEDAESSVAALVRSERVARCQEDLQRPGSGSVTEIGFRWGFSDAAHFSRVFKRELGITPSEVRRLALARTAQSRPSVDRSPATPGF